MWSWDVTAGEVLSPLLLWVIQGFGVWAKELYIRHVWRTAEKYRKREFELWGAALTPNKMKHKFFLWKADYYRKQYRKVHNTEIVE